MIVYSSCRISVIVPIYNVGPYLDDCIASITKQSYHNLEIILVDDGSIDNSFQICKQWENRDSRIRVYHKNQGGVSSARNFGIEHSCSAYIAFVDGDDIINIKMYEKLLDALVYNDADVSMCTYDRFYVKDDIKYCTENLENLDKVVFENGIIDGQKLAGEYDINISCNKLYKRGTFEDIRFPSDISYGEDLFIVPDILATSHKIVYIPEKLYYYRTRKSSISYNLSDRNCMDAIIVMKKMYNYSCVKHINELMYFDCYFAALTRAYEICKDRKGEIKVKYFGVFIKNLHRTVFNIKCWLFLLAPPIYFTIANKHHKNYVSTDVGGEPFNENYIKKQ